MNRSPSQDQRSEIKAKVRAVLRSEPRLGPMFHLRELKLESEGVILLDGEVPDVAAEKLALEKVAAIPGIAGIADHLHVKPASHMSDKEIRFTFAMAWLASQTSRGLRFASKTAANSN